MAKTLNISSVEPLHNGSVVSSTLNLPHSPTLQGQMETLLDVIQQLSLAKDLETIMYIVRRAARKLTGADGATFVLREDDKCYYADEDAISPLWKGKRFPMNICISGWVMLHKEAVTIKDIYADTRIPADAYRSTFVKSLAVVPIRTTSPVGAIGTYWAEPYLPSDEQVNLLKALADSISVAMENIQLQTELQHGQRETSAQTEITRKLMETNCELENTLAELNRRNIEMEWLKELSSKLQTCLYIEEAYRLIMQYAQLLLPDVSGVLYLMHPSRNYLEAMSSWGKDLNEEKIIKPDECLALRRGSTYKINDPQCGLTCAHYKIDKDFQSYSCVPLFAQSDIIGFFFLKWKDCKKSDIDIEKIKNNQDTLISMIAEQVAIGISNIKLRETLRNQSLRDMLTGLYNRRYLEETFARELSRSERKSSSLAIFMLDIDHFKLFNDKFGHEAGDMVIQALAKVLHNTVRQDDIACRYGGEEFILIMPDINLEEALQRAKALHEEISHIHLRYGGLALTQITVSIGVAMFPLHAKTTHGLIAASDAALYQAKNSGRNRTEIFNSII